MPRQRAWPTAAILADLAGASEVIARYRVLDPTAPATRQNQVAEFMAEFGLDFPVALKSDVDVLPDSPISCFLAYVSVCQASDLYDLSMAIINRFNPRMPELPLIKQNLNEHVETLHGALQELLSRVE